MAAIIEVQKKRSTGAASQEPLTASELAAVQEFRRCNGGEGRGPYVVLFDGGAQGFIRDLDHPASWRRNCVAVDESDAAWVNTGERWELLESGVAN